MRQLQRVHVRSAATFVDQMVGAAVEQFAGDRAKEARGAALAGGSKGEEAASGAGAGEGKEGEGEGVQASARAAAAAAAADQPTAVVRDLVQGFLLPDVEQSHLRKQLTQATMGAREAARASLASMGAEALL